MEPAWLDRLRNVIWQQARPVDKFGHQPRLQALIESVGAGLPEAKIRAVLQVIREHQPKDQPTSTEATILRDADILEQLGAVAILRTVSKVGRDTRFPRFTDAVAALRRSLEHLPGEI